VEKSLENAHGESLLTALRVSKEELIHRLQLLEDVPPNLLSKAQQSEVVK